VLIFKRIVHFAHPVYNFTIGADWTMLLVFSCQLVVYSLSRTRGCLFTGSIPQLVIESFDIFLKLPNFES
jgi:hypothetical protein